MIRVGLRSMSARVIAVLMIAVTPGLALAAQTQCAPTTDGVLVRFTYGSEKESWIQNEVLGDFVAENGLVPDLVLREPGNVNLARQRGAEVARSPWLLFSDADIELAPDDFTRLTRLTGTAVYYGPKLSRNRFRRYYQVFAMGQALCQACGGPAASGSNLW